MKNALAAIAGLMLITPILAPTWAAELRVTGFIDNVFPRFEGNSSSGDNDMTRNSDQATFGRQRARFFFNFLASDDLRGVFGMEIDNTFGAPARNRVGARCVTGTGAFAFEQCGFRNGIDVNNFEVKQLYVDFRVPQLPLSNRWRLGGLPVNVTPLHPFLLYTMDAGGGDVRFTFSEQVTLLLYYVQLEEDLDRFAGSAKIGEDYLTGGTLMLTPIAGLDVHLLGIYDHGQNPFGPALLGNGGPFNAVLGDSLNVTTEDRYYLGFDARYRVGNLSIEPSFIYLLGTRKFIGGSDIDFNAFQAHMVLFYNTGPWLLGGKFGYTSGNKAEDDISNRGIGTRSDVKGFRPLGVDGGHVFGQWLEILGSSDVDGTGSAQGPTSPGENGMFDRFGQIRLTAKAEYKYTSALTFEGAAGAVWTAERTGCPASVRIGSITGPCGGPSTSAGTPAFNFTGDSSYVGTEVAVGLRYTIMPGLTWTPRFAWAFLGDAWQSNDRNVQDAWVLVNRLIYIF